MSRNQFYKSSFAKNFVQANRRKPGELNKTEERYRGQLELMKQAGEIRDFRVHEHRLLVGRAGKDSHWYKPDFLVLTNDNFMVFVEVKGGKITQDGRSTFLDACEKHPWFGFKMVQLKNKRWITLMEG